MKKHFLFALCLSIVGVRSYSQIHFEEGYFINESNQITNCLVKNVDWKNNPTEFKYKILQDDSVRNVDIRTIKEFGIKGSAKYIRAAVKIDRSTDVVNDLTFERNPSFKEEILFLKVLIEGDASLFFYEDGNLTRYFFRSKDSTINQLVYKRYLNNDGNLAYNNLFRQQLLLAFGSQSITLKDIEHIAYKRRDLEKIFMDYNRGINSEFVNYKNPAKRDLFNFTIRPGVDFSDLVLENTVQNIWNVKFGKELSFRMGVEAEFILPLNKNKWGLVLEPTYQYYEASKIKQISDHREDDLLSKVKYQSIEIPFGIRHNFFISDFSKIFINGFYIFHFDNKSKVDFTKRDGVVVNTLNLSSRNNIALGLGFKYKNKYSIEMRYYSDLEILSDYLYWESDYRKYSIVLGYTLF